MIPPSYAAIAHRESFRHETLRLSENSIRLFQVQSGSDNEPISLRVTQYSIHRRPAYKAVSYTWGSSHNSQTILVNGRVFSLHPNLWNLLFHLRLRKETSFLWADRLCIDQQNLSERNFHVQLMGKIYDQASSVIVWLGLPGPDRTEIRAMDFIKEIAAFRKSNTDTVFVKSYLAPNAHHRWETLLRMCSHHYWSRTWIVQEFLRAKSVELLCAKASLDWDLFEAMLPFLQRYLVNNTALFTQLFQTRPVRLSLRRKAGEASNLHQLLQEYHDSVCTERRDKIYGIMGLAIDCQDGPNGEIRGIKADYDKHVVQVYLDAVHCIATSLDSPELIPSVANLVRRALLLSREDFVDYITRCPSSQGFLAPLLLRPDYVGKIKETISNWHSVNDLKQRLARVEWGDYVGYEMKVIRPKNIRRSSTRLTHSDLPDDFINHVVNAAELETELNYLHNYPQLDGLRVIPDQMALDEDQKRGFDNPESQKPSILLEQATIEDSLRLGFSCTNARRGDSLLQFRGLNCALVVRRFGADIVLIGKAVMIKHSEIATQPLDDVCDSSPWFSTCPSQSPSESILLESDALSLAELLSRPHEIATTTSHRVN